MMNNMNPANISIQESIDRLRTFNEVVDILQEYKFWKVFPKKSGFHISWDHTNERAIINSKVLGPDEEYKPVNSVNI
jgi:hypothetical protein